MNNLLHHVAVHVVLCISNHALYHVAAYGAGLLRTDVAIVALLKVYVQGIGHLHLKAVQGLLGVGYYYFIAACHSVFHLLTRLV